MSANDARPEAASRAPSQPPRNTDTGSEPDTERRDSREFTVRAYRVGLTTQGDVFQNGEAVMGVKNMFTVRGAQKEAEYLAGRLTEGATVSQLIQEDLAARLGW